MAAGSGMLGQQSMMNQQNLAAQLAQQGTFVPHGMMLVPAAQPRTGGLPV
jgi:hypothetical protein